MINFIFASLGLILLSRQLLNEDHKLQILANRFEIEILTIKILILSKAKVQTSNKFFKL